MVYSSNANGDVQDSLEPIDKRYLHFVFLVACSYILVMLVQFKVLVADLPGCVWSRREGGVVSEWVLRLFA